LDSSGNLYVADSTLNAVEELTFASGYSTVITLASNYNQPRGVAVDPSGNVYLGDYGNNAVEEVKTSNVNIGSINVKSTSSAIQLIFTFDTGGTIEAPVVLTQGATNLDFKDSDGGTCTSQGTSYPYGEGSTCIVDVSFKPLYPGPRYGAVQLLNNVGTVIATAYIYGTGTGPQVTFLPGTQSTFASASAPWDLSYPTAVAADAGGNVYIADYSNNAVYKETLSGGSYTQSTIYSSPSNPGGVAVDGSGNVYIANLGNETVIKETLSAGTYTPSTIYTGAGRQSSVTVDGSGNVYALDVNNGIVVKLTPSAGAYSPSTIISGLNNPEGIAVDGSGNLYIADTNNHQVLKETLSAGSSRVRSPALYISPVALRWMEGGTSISHPTGAAAVSYGRIRLRRGVIRKANWQSAV
jgi:streptogramin lyase